jgi:hypothetical protein
VLSDSDRRHEFRRYIDSNAPFAEVRKRAVGSLWLPAQLSPTNHSE